MTTTALQKAQYELERAYSQRSVKLYREGEGFVYEQSHKAIRDAQENYDNAKYNSAIASLEKQLDYYDDIIDNLTEIKDKWSNIASEAEDYLNIEKTLATIGVDGIFNASVIDKYTESYKNLLVTIGMLEEQILTWETFLDEVETVVSKYDWNALSLEEASAEIDKLGEKYLAALEEFQITDDLGNFISVDTEKIKKVIDEIKSVRLLGVELTPETDEQPNPSDPAVEVKTPTQITNDANKKHTIETNEEIKKDTETTYKSINEYIESTVGTVTTTNDANEKDTTETNEVIKTDSQKTYKAIRKSVKSVGNTVQETNDKNEIDTQETFEKIKTDAETAYGDVTQTLKNEANAQKAELEAFKSEMTTLFESMCSSMVSQVNSAFEQMSNQIISIAQTISSQVNSIVGNTQGNVQNLKNLANEASALAKTVESTSTSTSLTISGAVGGGSKSFNREILTYHDGIENGLVGEKDAGKGIKELALRKLEPSEIPAILKVNEAVLNEIQQGNVMNNFGTAFKAGLNLPKLERNSNTTPVVQNVTVNCPNLTGEKGFNEFKRQLDGLQLKAIQYANRR